MHLNACFMNWSSVGLLGRSRLIAALVLSLWSILLSDNDDSFLKVGHGAIGTFLARIGLIETPECWWCGAEEQTVEHLYARCRKWRRQRRKLVRELRK